MTAAAEGVKANSRDDLNGLWSRVWDWLHRWTAVFSPEDILRDGLSRRHYLQCCNWLRPLEAAARRILIAAALVFDPSKLSPTKQATSAGSAKESAKDNAATPPKRPASFRVLAMPGTGKPRKPGAARPGPVARHLPFPGDPLLRLGEVRRSDPASRLRPSHPLKRRGRIYPHDPDYIPREDMQAEEDYANSSRLLFGPFPDEHAAPKRRPDANALDRALYSRAPEAEADVSEWRRLEAEWARILPAPGLTARISALMRLMSAPGESVSRLARRLARKAGLDGLLRGAPTPVLRKPAYDRFGAQVPEELVPLSHAAIGLPDTS